MGTIIQQLLSEIKKLNSTVNKIEKKLNPEVDTAPEINPMSEIVEAETTEYAETEILKMEEQREESSVDCDDMRIMAEKENNIKALINSLNRIISFQTWQGKK